jgi:hypothetical protein
MSCLCNKEIYAGFAIDFIGPKCLKEALILTDPPKGFFRQDDRICRIDRNGFLGGLGIA